MKRTIAGEAPAGGITFMELMISLGVLSFIIFSICVLLALSQLRVHTVTDRDVAYTLADNMIESIRTLGFSDITPDITFSGGPPENEGTYYQFPPEPYPRIALTNYYPGTHGTAIISRSVEYTFTVRATRESDKSGDEIGNLKKVVVTVKWNEIKASGRSEEASIVLSSRILKR